MYFAKTPILVFYTRVFNIKKWLRVTSYATLAITAALYLAATIYASIPCDPRGKPIDDAFLVNCQRSTFPTSIWRCATAIATDIVILGLPIPTITGLNLPLSKRIGVAIVFLIGLLAIATAIISLYYQSQLLGGPSAMTIAMLCTCLECCIAIIVGCAPALRSFWLGFVQNSTVYPRMQGTLSNFTTKNTPSSNKSHSTNNSRNIEITTHRYIELNDRNHVDPAYEADASFYQPGIAL
ncbi:uncharacterized protein F4822DRAFT_413315 [Hypoxylon trugodes]|uniref:uncharacterized protein n=1 Tax=Hypoxylon trugodes TaxID=326681 RepID=UPI002192A9CE|nr:uncharacterized protein F4822DRAFT_413315 [Hypoxylon trugodes]KAI1385521.1 hypothetical protein F4822DRAFT_413315 [Hypoxylon trugodes]